MALLDILDLVRLPTDSQELAGFFIDHPVPGSSFDSYTLEIIGWVLGQTRPIVSVELTAPGHGVQPAVLSQARPDVARHFSTAAAQQPLAGFAIRLSVLGLEEQFALTLRTVFADGARVAFAMIRGRRGRLTSSSSFRPTLHPLIVTTLGRTGSTWLMHLLAEHPAIAPTARIPMKCRPRDTGCSFSRSLGNCPTVSPVGRQPIFLTRRPATRCRPGSEKVSSRR